MIYLKTASAVFFMINTQNRVYYNQDKWIILL